MKNKHLVLFFLVSLAIGLGMRRCSPGCGRPFRATLFDCDTTRLAEFSYKPSIDDTAEIAWAKGGDRWLCTRDGQTIEPADDIAARFMAALASPRIGQITARLPVKPGGEKAFFGKDSQTAELSFRQAGKGFGPFYLLEKPSPDGGPAATLARLSSGDEAFEMESGELLALLKIPFKSLRNRKLCVLKPEQVSSIAFNLPNRLPVVVDRVDGKWQCPGGERRVADARLAELFRVLKKVENGLPFADDFGEMEKSRAYSARLVVTGDAPSGSFSLVGFKVPGSGGFVLNSSQNPSCYFEAPDSLALLLFADPTIH